jgi:DNA-binding transcriptional MerR regulator
LRGLTKNDLTIIHVIVEHDPLTTTLTRIAEETQISIHTVKSSLRKLREKKVLDWERVVDGCTWATAYVVHERTKTLYHTHRDAIIDIIGGAKNCSFEIGNGPTLIPQNFHQMSHHVLGQNNHQLPPQFVQQNSHKQPYIDRKIKENLSILENLEEEARRLYQIDDDDMQIILPDLHKAGFTSANIRSLIERRHKNGLDLSDATAKMIRMGLRHADAALRIGDGTLKGTVNTTIEKSLSGYIFSVLLKDATFPKPPGWEPEEVLAQQLELERLRQEVERQRLEAEVRELAEAKLKGEREEQSYKAWRSALTPEEIAAYKDRCPSKKNEEALERFLRIEWRKTLG